MRTLRRSLRGVSRETVGQRPRGRVGSAVSDGTGRYVLAVLLTASLTACPRAPSTPARDDVVSATSGGDTEPPKPAEITSTDGGGTPPPDPRPKRTTIDPATIDVVAIELEVDLTTRRSVAHVTFAQPTPTGVAANDPGELSLEVGDLKILHVRPGKLNDPWFSEESRPELGYRIEAGRLHFDPAFDQQPTLPTFATVALPPGIGTRRVAIEFEPQVHDVLEGMHTDGTTMSWPEHCGKLFPCNPEPTDGVRFQLQFTGVPEGSVVVAPERVTFDAPSYMLAWAVGPYVKLPLGQTKHGTDVVVFVRPSIAGEEAAMKRGTAELVREFEFLEDTLGPYPYGDEVGSVAAPWPKGAYGGMEHHPYWHVAAAELHDTSVHAHEAAHGWFGNGIRVACWEDLVLSEGFATYLEGRAKEYAAGVARADTLWAELDARWDMMGEDGAAPQAWWPDTCDADDPITAGYFSSAPYVRGAMFFRALERKLGRETFDATVRVFVEKNLGQARRLVDFLEHVRVTTGYDPRPCAEAWLVSSTLPVADRCVAEAK